MHRLATIGLVLCGALLVAATATAMTKPVVPRPVVPRAVQLRILHMAPVLPYTPTRMAYGFHYVSWQKSPSNLTITFANKAGWEVRFKALRASGSCRTGMEKSFQLDGNKVYWSHSGAEQMAWRCVTGPNGRQVRLVASSPQPPGRFADVGLGQVAASGKRIAPA